MNVVFGLSAPRAVLSAVVLGLAFGASSAVAQDATALESLTPSEMMARYQANCAGGIGAGTVESGATETRALGERCDALARAIQGLDFDARRAGSADLARPDFYTPRPR